MRQDSRAKVTLIVPSPFEKRNGDLRRPTPKERRDLVQLYGAPIIVDGFDYGQKPRLIKGLVVHLVENREGIRDYRGEINFFDGRTKLYRQLLDNKWAEYERIREIDPQIMPESYLASDLLSPSKSFRANRSKLTRSLNQELQSQNPQISTSTQILVRVCVETFLAATKKIFPNGAFIKYIREFHTREAGQLTHTPEASPEKIAEIFCHELAKIKAKLMKRNRRWGSPQIAQLMRESHFAAVHIVGFLLLDASQIMVQKKLDIKKVRDGTLAEVRVDFGSGGPIIANVRWGYDVEIDYKRRAFEFFQNFWQKWPPELKKQFGGADVVFLKDGSMKIIEFNFGSESGFIDATQLIVMGNLFISKILGRPTPLIKRLEALVAMNTKDQINELSKLIPKTKRDDETHFSLRDLHLPDVFLYLRDRLIENWLENPTKVKARELSVQLQQLARSQHKRIEDPKVRTLILDMARFGTEALNQLKCLKMRQRPLYVSPKMGRSSGFCSQ